MQSFKTCNICEEVADSVHFGALSCKACAAFFRRVVGGNQKLIKRCSGVCSMRSRLRKLCGSCRFEKCLQTGMKKELVESKSHLKFGKTNDFSILEYLIESYEQLKSMRKLTFGEQEEGCIKLCNYKKMNDILCIDLKLVHQSLIKFFESITQLEDANQKSLLAAHFIIPFIVMHGAFNWTHENLFQLPNGEYIDLSGLEEYYEASDEDEKATQSKRMLEPYWKLNTQVLRTHFSEVKLDQSEFLLLSALLYWDFGLDGQTDDCTEACQAMRQKVLSEMTQYEKEKLREGDDSLRVGQIMIILQTMHKSMSILHEFREVALFFDLYGKDNPLFHVMRA